MKTKVKWRKSSFSSGNGGACVELAHLGNRVVGVRDSKDPNGPRLTFSRSAILALLEGAKAGEFDDLA